MGWKVKIKRVTPVEVIDFCKDNGIEMEVIERTPMTMQYCKHKWYCTVNAEIKDDCLLIGCSGNGMTPDGAVNNFAEQISERLIVMDAMDKEKRREIWCPVLTHTKRLED